MQLKKKECYGRLNGYYYDCTLTNESNFRHKITHKD